MSQRIRKIRHCKHPKALEIWRYRSKKHYRRQKDGFIVLTDENLTDAGGEARALTHPLTFRLEKEEKVEQ